MKPRGVSVDGRSATRQDTPATGVAPKLEHVAARIWVATRDAAKLGKAHCLGSGGEADGWRWLTRGAHLLEAVGVVRLLDMGDVLYALTPELAAQWSEDKLREVGAVHDEIARLEAYGAARAGLWEELGARLVSLGWRSDWEG